MGLDTVRTYCYGCGVKRKAPKGLISVGDSADKYGLSRSTIYRLAHKGKLTIYRRAGDRRSYVERERLKKLVVFRPTKL